ncbi:DNA-directed RNA polymerase subunit alpha [Tepiditoga spiralis]|uniref:DNA-directed RNA polymerase subunit alpha n=1 Tax=Tepiditoga spiralis TaxID=2108365 RepID=A0A7G1G7Q1_9BACT|nr:DNA-directed RNA polymerase subunit alpha [Tepiditoga spiralis]BBE30923.1 DNA-directed RNA polymerase subunit alpha [Tepiditoga spiralis]
MELYIKPETFEVVEERKDNEYNYAKFEMYPLEKGYAITMGNALRRVMLSTIPAFAIVGLRVPGKLHEFDTIEGITEDILEISLNLKKVQIKATDSKLLEKNEEFELVINKTGIKGEPVDILAGDIQTPTGLEIANPEYKIATLNSDNNVEMYLYARPGKGFVSARDIERTEEQKDVEYIYIDGAFSPVLKVNFLTENYRVGKVTDYDKLILEVWTKNNIEPLEALKRSTTILMDHFMFMSKYWKDSTGEESQEPIQDMGTGLEASEALADESAEIPGVSREILETSIDNLDLTKRAKNCLKRERINVIGELFKKTPEELMKIKNFGKKSLDEIRKELIDKFGLDYDKVFNERRSK